ncbi:BTAD domain-containing putative transcriptional regulator [Pseudothermotoga sp.]|uniref:AfsR/SARP family transcriptional regulator n=1 Tax=Pseudothermotoga sp. TaxID=2033661 RepID=UPI0031F6D224
MQISIFGQFKITDNKGEVHDLKVLKSRKARDLLRYFVVFHQRKIPAELLCEIFWPGMEEKYARRSLQTAVSSIRRFLKEDLLSYQDGAYCFDGEGSVTIDAEQFENSILRAKSSKNDEKRLVSLKEAVQKYTNDVMPDCVYQDWIAQAREHYKDLFIDALLELIELYERKGDQVEVRNLSKKVLSEDPFNETACLSYMKATSELGHEIEALQFYERFSNRMEKELGILPSQELKSFHDELALLHKQPVWIITIKVKKINEAVETIKNFVREKDEIKIFSTENVGVFIKDVDGNTAKSIQKRLEQILKEHSLEAKTSLRLAR